MSNSASADPYSGFSQKGGGRLQDILKVKTAQHFDANHFTTGTGN